MPTSTPWGPSQQSRQITRGIMNYCTASHGGYRVSPTMMKKMPGVIRDVKTWAGEGWYEEDCDWALVALAFPDFFSDLEINAAYSTAKFYHADKFNVDEYVGSSLNDRMMMIKKTAS